MTAQLQSELRKLTTTRTAPVLLLAAVAMAAFGALSEGLSGASDLLARREEQRMLFGQVTSVAVFFATLAGLLAVTSEFRYGTIRWTLTFEPRRHVVLGAKLLAAALVALGFAACCVAVALGGGIAISAARDVDPALTAGDTLVLVLGPFAASALSAMIGVALGTLIRNQVGAIVAFVAYGFLVDALLFAAAPSIGRFFPGQAGNALVGQVDEHFLAPGIAVVVVAAWTLAFVGVALGRDQRTDV
jgi:ABC-type transport system involved in multi-copper enzyme maturation permease subunit